MTAEKTIWKLGVCKRPQENRRKGRRKQKRSKSKILLGDTIAELNTLHVNF